MKKRYLSLMICFFMFITLVGCSSNNKETNDQNTNIKTEDLNNTKPLKIAISTEIDFLDPYLSSASDTSAIMDNVFDGLTRVNENGEIVPAIAKDWTISEDGLEYTFFLNDNVYFHNGKKLTAEDVKYSYYRLAGLDNKKAANSEYEQIVKDVKIINDNEVKIILKNVDSSFLSQTIKAIVQKDYNNNNSLPIGTGPYKFSNYEIGKKIVLEKFDNYYDKKRIPKIKTVEFLFVPDDNAKMLGLKSGSIDAIDGSQDMIKQLDNANFDNYTFPSNTIQLLMFNLNREPFNIKEVRQAINYALNRNAINKLTANDKNLISYSIVTKAMPFWYDGNTEYVYDYNLKKAKELLTQAGYPNGFEMELTVPSNYDFHVNTAQIISDELSKIGIKVKINQVEWGVWLDNVYTKANYQTTLTGLTGKADPHSIFRRFYSKYSKNFSNYNNSLYDSYIESALLETDVNKRKEIYDKAQMLLTNDAVTACLQDPGKSIITTKDIKGFIQYPISFWDLSKLYFK